jgi:hypothetical protein
LSTDLPIEQILMPNVKTAGGLIKGSGIGESQRALWLLSMSSCAEVNQAMQDVTDVGFYTSEQHKEETKARQERDQKDVLSIIDVMKDRSLFAGDADLRNIETGVGADHSANEDNAKGVGDKIIKSMEGRNILDFNFKRKYQVVTMSSKTSIKIDGKTVRFCFRDVQLQQMAYLMTSQIFLNMNYVTFRLHFLMPVGSLVRLTSRYLLI